MTFPRAARKAGAKAIHTQYNLSPLAGRSGVTTIHDVSFFIGPEWFLPRDRLVLSRFVPASAKRAAAVLTVSQTSRDEIERFIPSAKGKITVTPLALNPRVHPVERMAAEELLLSELGIKAPYVLTVGTQWPRKNTRLAVEAARLLPQSIPHRLVVTGKSGWEDVPESDRIVRPGYVSDEQLSALYSAASLYLLPSFHEGFGLTLLEAFACRCPVLASRGGAIPETAGSGAALVADWEPSTWSSEIERILGDSGTLEEMQRKGLQRLANFSWSDTAHRTIEVYRQVGSW